MTDNGRDLRTRLPDTTEHGIISLAREGAAEGYRVFGGASHLDQLENHSFDGWFGHVSSVFAESG